MIDIAEELIEAKCDFCRGFKFLRGGYPCPKCGGTGGTSASSLDLTGGHKHPNLEALFLKHWGAGALQAAKSSNLQYIWLSEILARYGNRPATYLTGAAPQLNAVAKYIEDSGGEQVTTPGQVVLFEAGVINYGTLARHSILVSWLVVVE